MEQPQFGDFINMPLERLDARGKELTAAIRGNYLNEERKAQVQAEISQIAFELWQRHEEGKIEFYQQ
jgi:hypothetical protein